MSYLARCGRYLSDLLLGEIVAKGAGARLRSQDRDPRPETGAYKTTSKDTRESRVGARTPQAVHVIAQ
ncbi:hypothetical protein E4U34_006707 [Claviceps purpurea]|nr:hypothetical protein E4U28_000689 [Claviceps purpurea]KAG6213481.1 hypothetical protein E4U34_006707 [Claviceps purpurea]